MKKLKVLINKKRKHFTKRVALRKGKLKWIWYFILSKKADDFINKSGQKSQVYKYKKIIFFVTEDKLQTYIDTRISKQDEKMGKKLHAM